MLNDDDIDMLMDALDALEKKDGLEAVSGGILKLMLVEDKEQAKRDFSTGLEEAQKKTKSMRESIILLKAKLIMMKDKNTVANAKSFIEKRES